MRARAVKQERLAWELDPEPTESWSLPDPRTRGPAVRTLRRAPLDSSIRVPGSTAR